MFQGSGNDVYTIAIGDSRKDASEHAPRLEPHVFLWACALGFRKVSPAVKSHLRNITRFALEAMWSAGGMSRARIVTLFAAKIDNRRVSLYRLRHGLMLFTVGLAQKWAQRRSERLPGS